MKVKQISEHIWKCSLWLLFPMSVWIVKTEQGLTLVDTGIPWMAGGIKKQLESMRLPLERILLTHGHSDHVGGLDGILKAYRVPVFAHAAEIPYMEGRLPYPRRSKPEKAVEAGLVRPLTMEQAVAGLVPYWTPGHSPGHTVFYHEQDRVLLAGDLFTSKRGRLRSPMAMFTADMKQAVESGAIVTRLQPELVSVCHGGDIAGAAGQYAEYRRAFE